MVEGARGQRADAAVGVDQAQAGLGLDAADARHRRGTGPRGGSHGGAGLGRGGEDQFVVVAAGQRDA